MCSCSGTRVAPSSASSSSSLSSSSFVWLSRIDFVKATTTKATSQTTTTTVKPSTALSYPCPPSSLLPCLPSSPFPLATLSALVPAGFLWLLVRLSPWCFHLHKIEHLTGKLQTNYCTCCHQAESRPLSQCEWEWVGRGKARARCLSQCHCQCIHLKDYKRICRLFAAKWTHLPAAAEKGREREWVKRGEDAAHNSRAAACIAVAFYGQWIDEWMHDKLTNWRTDKLPNGPLDWLTEGLPDWLTAWLTEWAVDWLERDATRLNSTGSGGHGVT